MIIILESNLTYSNSLSYVCYIKRVSRIKYIKLSSVNTINTHWVSTDTNLVSCRTLINTNLTIIETN